MRSADIHEYAGAREHVICPRHLAIIFEAVHRPALGGQPPEEYDLGRSAFLTPPEASIT